MKKILITGTSHGIGNQLAKDLLDKGYFVYGISKTTANINNSNYREHLMNLCDTAKVVDLYNKELKNLDFDILINNAGVGYYGPHITLSPEKIHEMVTVNLEVPMLLSNLLLPSLTKNSGMIINISSVTAKKDNNTHGVAYGATKAGLTSFGESLFAETRKNNLRIVNIHPEMTSTNLYRNADFETSTDDGCALTPQQVAQAVIYAIEAPEGMIVNDITLNPQFNRISRKK